VIAGLIGFQIDESILPLPVKRMTSLFETKRKEEFRRLKPAEVL
jgi:hypothetical protein